jgi:hypothetical protein
MNKRDSKITGKRKAASMDAISDETLDAEDSPLTDEYFQQFGATFEETFGSFQTAFTSLFESFQQYHGFSTQISRTWAQIQAKEHVEADRLDQVEPEIDGFTAQFDETAGDELTHA